MLNDDLWLEVGQVIVAVSRLRSSVFLAMLRLGLYFLGKSYVRFLVLDRNHELV